MDKDRARRRLREWFGVYYNDPDRADRVSVWGSVDQVVEGLHLCGHCLTLHNLLVGNTAQKSVKSSKDPRYTTNRFEIFS